MAALVMRALAFVAAVWAAVKASELWDRWASRQPDVVAHETHHRNNREETP